MWSRLDAEQERLRKAMGRDFQVRATKRSASDIRGRPITRSLSAQEVATNWNAVGFHQRRGIGNGASSKAGSRGGVLTGSEGYRLSGLFLRCWLPQRLF